MEDEVGLGRVLEAIHSYEYEAESKDGSKRQIKMLKGDRYILLRTANVEWWDVIYYDFRERPDKRFYVPAKYVNALEITIGEGECDHDDFKRRLEKNNRRQKKQNRRTQDRLSTFDDGTMLDVGNRWSVAEPEHYQPNKGVSTLMRSQMRRGSDPDQTNVVGQLVKENIGQPLFVLTGSRENLSHSPKRVTPVPPPSLDTTRDLMTPDPESESEVATISPKPVRKRDPMGMSMTANTARRLDNMPEPVKPANVRRSNEDQRVSPVEHIHSRYSSLGSAGGDFPKSRTQSDTDNVFSSDWTCEVDADTGSRYWFANFTTVRWRECYDAQTNNYYYWDEENNEVTWQLPERPDEQSSAPKTPNLTSKRGTIHYNKFDTGKKVSTTKTGWGEIHGNFLNIYKTAPKQVGGGTIYSVEPEIRIDFYRSKIRNPSTGLKTKKNEDLIKYFDLISPHLKFETLIKDDNCWLQEASEKHKSVNNRQRWSTRKSVRNIDSTKIEKALQRSLESPIPPATTTEKIAKSKSLPKANKKQSAKLDTEAAGWSLNSLFRKGTSKEERRKDLVKRGIIKNNYFGSPIQDILKNEKSKVPEFITWCIEHIEKDIVQDGIYRVAANQATVHALRLDVDRGVERAKWKYGNEVHVVCGALKLFFRELPESLINPKTETQYQQWTELPNFDKVTLQNQVKKLLKHSIDESLKPTLKALFDHFQNVLAHSTANRMAAQNIAIVFGPTLIQAPGTVAPSYQSIMTHNNIIHTLIDNYEQLKPFFL